jgi:hypothetical protein
VGVLFIASVLNGPSSAADEWPLTGLVIFWFRVNFCWLRQHSNSWFRPSRDPWPYFSFSRPWLGSETGLGLVMQCSEVICCWPSPAQLFLVSGPVGTHDRCLAMDIFAELLWLHYPGFQAPCHNINIVLCALLFSKAIKCTGLNPCSVRPTTVQATNCRLWLYKFRHDLLHKHVLTEVRVYSIHSV